MKLESGSAASVVAAWSIREGARETGGLGGVWLVKTVLPIACVLMLVQGSALLLRPPAEAPAP